MVRRIFLSFSLALVVASCGGDDEGTATTSSGSRDQETTTSAGSESTDGSGDAESLADFLGGGIAFSDDPEAAQAEARQVDADIQERIRQCMAEQGFEYLPVIPPEGAFTFAAGDQREFAETQGFGITTWFGTETEFETGDEWVDPNQERIDAMSESEQAAYYEALHGSPGDQEMITEVDPDTGEELTYSEGFGGGCSGEVYEEVYGDQQRQTELWGQLGPALDEMYQRVEADPRIVAVNERWSACMAGAGHDYTSRSDMYEQVFTDLQARFDEIVGADDGYVDPMEGMTAEEIEAFFEETSEEETEASFADAERSRLEAVDQEALTALQQEEIDIAVADVECSEDYDDVYAEVAGEYESDFIAENREQLEEIRDAQGGG